jgi:aryl-alcohol dehydrogenase-like predicted oxidoreductase
MERTNLERREFLKTGLLAAGTALGAGAVAAAQPDPKAAGQGLPTRKFGQTGLSLPVFGMGGSAMIKLGKWADYGVEMISLEERIAMVRKAYDSGIRYFDTARIYLESESIMGKGLKGVRDKVFLATKVAEVNPANVRPSLETSLKELNTDYVDLLQIHSPAIERVGFDGALKLHAEIVKLRDQKMVRYIGLTTHVAFETVHKLICTGGFDQVLLANGYFHKGLDTLHSHRNLEMRELCLAKAAELKMAVVTMKIMGHKIFGHNAKNLLPSYDKAALAKLPGAAIRWALQDERVSVLNIGISLPEDIDKDVAIFKGDLKFTNDDRLLLADFAAKAYEEESIKKMRVV